MANQPHPFFITLASTVRTNRQLAAVLLSEHPNLITIRGCDGQTVLHEAVAWNDPEAVRFVLARGADANAATDHGSTALIDAAKCGLHEICRILLDHGARIATREVSGDTALSGAALMSRYDVVGLLLSHLGSEDVNQHFDDFNAAALHRCQAGPITDLLRLRGLRDPLPEGEVAELELVAVG